ncbi:polyphosphate kinase 2 family protein [Thiobacillus sedimenti]|uniref:Polyphosphate kinase 2 family protein n=1 Tax=Thiobacillus sedimenti TaxID=3110231 RepID=A0ABZ1CII8_9PROT|nr:polyphosphate kinase 2 family protein [Thiobacillus sp. SCUT-2]WRS39004.1 polyphosphate kinase 2 family protein [Thiobacillus sp. SCUT-2]
MKPAATRIKPGSKVRLSHWDPDDDAIVGKHKADAHALLDAHRSRLETLQELLYAEGRHRLLVVLQAMDTAGKDSTIRHVFQGVDPLGVKVACFKVPTPAELAHDFLWRVHPHVPGAGEIAIFNRSHYEDVLVTRVNGWIDADECKRRYRQINDFEGMLAETGTTILKFYLHISKDEQKKRLEERRDDPEKQWKFQPGDLAVRARWDDYMDAYEAALSATSTPHAPWHVIPANSKLARNLMVSSLLIDALEGLDMRYPDPVAGAAQTVID